LQSIGGKFPSLRLGASVHASLKQGLVICSSVKNTIVKT
jgi:hypothetical protein